MYVIQVRLSTEATVELEAVFGKSISLGYSCRTIHNSRRCVKSGEDPSSRSIRMNIAGLGGGGEEGYMGKHSPNGNNRKILEGPQLIKQQMEEIQQVSSLSVSA